ncbi:MAG: LPS biosynthesis protein, partial [Pseudomonadaceae bacterium]|nr:LPS biosynthesis protein [Pseudomonadaceae bacterium]
MANQRPPFRPTFSLLLASGLLLAQPASSLAASQVECRPSSDGRGWACNPLETTSQLPPRPQAPVVRASEPAQQPVSTEQPRQPAPAEQRRVVDFSELDWVPRDQLT